MGDLLQLVGQYGLPMVLLFIVGYAYDRKEKECKLRDRELTDLLIKEQAARVEDAKAYHEISRKIQGDIMIAVGKLSEVQASNDLQREMVEAINKTEDQAIAFREAIAKVEGSVYRKPGR